MSQKKTLSLLLFMILPFMSLGQGQENAMRFFASDVVIWFILFVANIILPIISYKTQNKDLALLSKLITIPLGFSSIIFFYTGEGIIGILVIVISIIAFWLSGKNRGRKETTEINS